MTEKEMAQLALDVQNAVNLTAILRSWNQCSIALMAKLGNFSGEFKRHPVQVLFLSKVLSLMAVGGDCLGGVYSGAMSQGEGSRDLFITAYRWCQSVASGEEVSDAR